MDIDSPLRSFPKHHDYEFRLEQLGGLTWGAWYKTYDPWNLTDDLDQITQALTYRQDVYDIYDVG
jgi:hypothetical protein